MRTRLGTWLLYALAGLVLTSVVAAVGMLLVARADRSAIAIAAAVAYVLQLISFALVVALRDNAQLFLTAWLVGLVLRFVVLGLGAFVLNDTSSPRRAPLLLSYVVFVFLLLLLEPLFLRWDLRRQ